MFGVSHQHLSSDPKVLFQLPTFQFDVSLTLMTCLQTSLANLAIVNPSPLESNPQATTTSIDGCSSSNPNIVEFLKEFDSLLSTISNKGFTKKFISLITYRKNLDILEGIKGNLVPPQCCHFSFHLGKVFVLPEGWVMIISLE